MTDFLKFMQQTTSLLSEADDTICKQCLLQSTYLMNRSKVRAGAQKFCL